MARGRRFVVVGSESVVVVVVVVVAFVVVVVVVLVRNVFVDSLGVLLDWKVKCLFLYFETNNNN